MPNYTSINQMNCKNDIKVGLLQAFSVLYTICQTVACSDAVQRCRDCYSSIEADIVKLLLTTFLKGRERKPLRLLYDCVLAFPWKERKLTSRIS
jgi:hypothetical protein